MRKTLWCIGLFFVLTFFSYTQEIGKEWNWIESNYPELGKISSENKLHSNSFTKWEDFWDMAFRTLQRRTAGGGQYWFKLHTDVTGDKGVTVFSDKGVAGIGIVFYYAEKGMFIGFFVHGSKKGESQFSYGYHHNIVILQSLFKTSSDYMLVDEKYKNIIDEADLDFKTIVQPGLNWEINNKELAWNVIENWLGK